MILVLDNYDSFVFNLARYFQRLGQETEVVRSDAIDADSVAELGPAAIVISPGPCTPKEAGCSVDVIRRLHTQIPILGVCLGHQAIVEALGGRVIRCSEAVHGRQSLVEHDGSGVFAGIPCPLPAGRYHSLVAEEAELPECLVVNARLADGTVMGVAHRELPVIGVQFHPESILTPHGYPLLANFLRLAGLGGEETSDHFLCELVEPNRPARVLPQQPVTF